MSIFEGIDFTTIIRDNLIWLLLTGALFLFIKPFQSIYVTRKILRRNRETLGNGYGDHLADIFIEIWYAKRPLLANATRELRVQNATRTLSLERLSQKLVDWKLVEKKEDKLLPIKNIRNKLIIFFTKIYLIKITGDKADYYKNLKK
jgi:hypothetical protein